MSDPLILGRDADGQPTAKRPPVAGDVLLEVAPPRAKSAESSQAASGGVPKRFAVEYVVSSRVVSGVVHTCCGVSWDFGRAASTITVRSKDLITDA